MHFVGTKPSFRVGKGSPSSGWIRFVESRGVHCEECSGESDVHQKSEMLVRAPSQLGSRWLSTDDHNVIGMGGGMNAHTLFVPVGHHPGMTLKSREGDLATRGQGTIELALPLKINPLHVVCVLEGAIYKRDGLLLRIPERLDLGHVGTAQIVEKHPVKLAGGCVGIAWRWILPGSSVA